MRIYEGNDSAKALWLKHDFYHTDKRKHMQKIMIRKQLKHKIVYSLPLCVHRVMYQHRKMKI